MIVEPPSFPVSRPRRLRASAGLREISAEVRLSPSMFMLPLFVSEAVGDPTPISSLEGHYYYPPGHEALARLVGEAMDHGIRSFLLFGVPKEKDEVGSRAWASDGPVQRALRYLRRELGWEPVIATDLCICGYSSHGHCGIPVACPRGYCIDNDRTLEVYQRIAVSQAEAGADLIAPSGMMDGQVGAIRRALDDAGYREVGIMAYSAKYASSFYGPFRGVMDSAPRFGDRSTYQMDPRRAADALREVMLDVKEGADIVMVKPALAYLDIIYRVSRTVPYLPIAAYNVSGEYMMVKAAAKAGIADRDTLMMEILTAIARAGASIIITYHAIEAARILRS